MLQESFWDDVYSAQKAKLSYQTLSKGLERPRNNFAKLYGFSRRFLFGAHTFCRYQSATKVFKGSLA